MFFYFHKLYKNIVSWIVETQHNTVLQFAARSCLYAQKDIEPFCDYACRHTSTPAQSLHPGEKPCVSI